MIHTMIHVYRARTDWKGSLSGMFVVSSASFQYILAEIMMMIEALDGAVEEEGFDVRGKWLKNVGYADDQAKLPRREVGLHENMDSLHVYG